jgi:integrase
LIVSYKDTEGKRRQVWKTYHCNRPEADRKLREMLTELDRDVFVRPTKSTVRQFLEGWLRDYVAPNLAPRTHELYSYMCAKHIYPTLGNIPLPSLRPAHLQRLYADKLASGLSNATVHIIHRVLHKSLKYGTRSGILSANVAALVDPPKVHRPEMHIMNEASLQAFLDAARGTDHYALFYTYLFTAARRSELLAVTWASTDLDLCQLSITRTMQYLHSEPPENRITFKQPKTPKSRRTIALAPATVAVLREHRAKQIAMRKELGLPKSTEDDLVFCHWDGSPFVPTSITQAWRRLARRCGLAGIRLHDARHTHASLMLKQNVHPKIVSERLGHAGIGITLDLYSHVVPGLQEAAALKFEEAISRANSVSKALAEEDN